MIYPFDTVMYYTTKFTSIDITCTTGYVLAENVEFPGTSTDGDTSTDVYTGYSSGKTLSFEMYNIPDFPSDVKHIKITFAGTSSKSGWVSIREINVSGS